MPAMTTTTQREEHCPTSFAPVFQPSRRNCQLAQPGVVKALPPSGLGEDRDLTCRNPYRPVRVTEWQTSSSSTSTWCSSPVMAHDASTPDRLVRFTLAAAGTRGACPSCTRPPQFLPCRRFRPQSPGTHPQSDGRGRPHGQCGRAALTAATRPLIAEEQNSFGLVDECAVRGR